MFANFFNLGGNKPGPHHEDAFVHDVRVEKPRPRSPQIERLLWWSWALIALKSALIFWACAHYPVPFSPLWVVLPTVAFALLCTVIYFASRR